ncbi:E3 ubiquitin/ISG15 ligase TRIM25-like [Lates japonicus]
METDTAVLPEVSSVELKKMTHQDNQQNSTETREQQSCPVEEPSQENVQTESEIRVQEDDLTTESARDDRKDKDVKVKDHLKTNQRERRTISPLTLLKEDFSQFKEEVLKVFKDKDTRTENEDRPSSSALSLLREDLSQFKEDVTSIFNISSAKDKDLKSTDPKTSQSAERTINLSISSVFRISKILAAKEDSSKIKAERTDDPSRSLFRRDQKLLQTSEKADDSQEVKTLSEKTEDQTDDDLKEKLSEQNEETVDAEKTNNITKDEVNESEDREVDIDVSEETTTGVSEPQQSKEMTCTSQTADQSRGSDDSTEVSGEDEEIKGEIKEEKEEDKPSETLPLETLFSGISLFNLTDAEKHDMRDEPGRDLWSVKNFAYYLTFDPNTANSELHLTDRNRTATRVWSDHRSSDHPDRFELCPQVLCREGLLDSAYWEVEWSGGADIGVTYNSISRDGDTTSCLLGHNERSWSLECSEGSYTPCYNNKRFRSSSPKPFTRTVGVYLNWSDGSLSFYCVSQDAMVHLYTFTSTFTEPLYPGFWVWAYDGSVSLRQVELDWERLLQ